MIVSSSISDRSIIKIIIISIASSSISICSIASSAISDCLKASSSISDRSKESSSISACLIASSSSISDCSLESSSISECSIASSIEFFYILKWWCVLQAMLHYCSNDNYAGKNLFIKYIKYAAIRSRLFQDCHFGFYNYLPTTATCNLLSRILVVEWLYCFW